MVKLLWNAGPPKGWTDVIPDAWFRSEGTRGDLEHAVLGPKRESLTAACAITVSGKLAKLTYGGQHAKFNSQNGLFLGDLELKFSDPMRQNLKEVWWRDEGKSEFEDITEIITIG